MSRTTSLGSSTNADDNPSLLDGPFRGLSGHVLRLVRRVHRRWAGPRRDEPPPAGVGRDPALPRLCRLPSAPASQRPLPFLLRVDDIEAGAEATRKVALRIAPPSTRLPASYSGDDGPSRAPSVRSWERWEVCDRSGLPRQLCRRSGRHAVVATGVGTARMG